MSPFKLGRVFVVCSTQDAKSALNADEMMSLQFKCGYVGRDDFRVMWFNSKKALSAFVSVLHSRQARFTVAARSEALRYLGVG